MSKIEELFAKLVLENCFPDKFTNLQLADKPDLQQKDKIGVEVTNCMPKDVAESFALLHKKDISKINIEKLEKSGVTIDDKGILWTHSTNDEKELAVFYESITQKLTKLNAGYKELNAYELFVNSCLLIDDEFHTLPILEEIKRRSVGYSKRFSLIYLLDIASNLWCLDLDKNSVKRLYLYGRADKLYIKANELIKEKKYV